MTGGAQRGNDRSRGRREEGRGGGAGWRKKRLKELLEPEQRRLGPNLTPEICAGLFDLVINHTLIETEKGFLAEKQIK